jgi:hypothetical protein
MVPGKVGGVMTPDQEISGRTIVAPRHVRAHAHETPPACILNLPDHGENTAPSFVVSEVVEKLYKPQAREEARVASVLVPLPGVESPEIKRLKERNRRKRIIDTFEQLTRSVDQGGLGMSKSAAAKHIGEAYTNIWRYQKAFHELGEDGLMPDTANSGRTSAFEAVLLNEAFRTKLIELYLATIGASGGNVTVGRRTAKMATALTAMADEPECPALLADKLRQGKFPICLQRFLKRITPEQEARLRGPKHFQLQGLVSRRDLTLRFPDGSRAEMPAGFKWVFDDMSSNQPFWLQLNGEFLFSRQGLYGIDHRALRWLGKMLVARPREAYRAEDILRFLRQLFAAYGGKPDVIVFERGVWHARKIRGFKLTETGAVMDDEFERPEMSEEARTNLKSGLEALGVTVIFATSAHGKIIETCFNHLQDILAIKARQFVNIGRHAGEFETGAKRLRQVRAGSQEPARLGFAPMNELSDCIDSAFTHINGKINSRKEVPDEIFFRGLETRPLSPLVPEDNAVFMTDMRKVTIKGGLVSVDVDGVPHDFRAEWMAELGTGYRVFVKLDPMNPALGAAIYNREPVENPKNRQLGDYSDPETRNSKPFGVGDFIGFAPWEIPAPSVDVTGEVRGVVSRPLEDFYPGAIDQGDTLRRKQQKAVATIFSALPRPGQPAIKTVEATDGLGNTVRVEKGERTEIAGAEKLQPVRRERRTQAVGVEMDEFEQQAQRLAEQEQRRKARLSEQQMAQFADDQ